VDLTYITPRGKWYFVSWKGHHEKSGGVAMNIGVHFFDMLQWIFGAPRRVAVHHRDDRSVAGFLDLEHADVRWMLSVDGNDLALAGRSGGTHRALTIDGDEFEFSEGFTDLHTAVYRETLAGRGFGIDDCKPSIELVHGLDNIAVEVGGAEAHPLVAAMTERRDREARR
jgi:UDP-N-acetyl-2-amino-2-deoxyglucuronate dehydrogenase